MINVFNDEDPAVIDDWKKYGRRNIANLTIAPTGSISLLTRTTSGIEPLFLPFYKRRRKTEDPSKSVFKDEVGDMWEEYLVIHPKFEDWYKINYNDGKPMSEMSSDELTELFKMSPYYKSTSEDVDYYGKIKMQGSIQKYVDHSISMTTNIPESSSKSLVADLYMLAWKYGCKGATVYRSGSRSGVLVSVNNKSTDEFDYVNAAKRPKELPCNVHTMIANGKKHNVFVGLLNDKPYEIFITDYFTNEKNLVIKKLGRGKYNLLKDGKLYVANLTSDMSDEQETITRLISTSLRHRADIKFIVEQLLKTRGNILSFCKVLARTLKQYIPDGASSTIKCSECGSSNVVFEEGCNKCNDCGGSKCG
jgi:ribonucleoside-diphosphate reductase alpha chain